MLEEMCRALSTTLSSSVEEASGVETHSVKREATTAASTSESGRRGATALETKEEITRSVCGFWEELLGGGLASYLNAPASAGSEHSASLMSQACNVLATMGAPVMAALKVSM